MIDIFSAWIRAFSTLYIARSLSPSLSLPMFLV